MRTCTRCGSGLDPARDRQGLLACPRCDVMREVVQCPRCRGTSRIVTGRYAGMELYRRCTCVAGLVPATLQRSARPV